MPSRRKPQIFQRPILSDDNKIRMRLSSKFTREHRKNILDNVSISVPDGKLWSLGLMISGDCKLWLRHGWLEFAEFYCLKTGHWLLFDYQGKSVFHVRIYDQSTCEINYSPPKKYTLQRRQRRKTQSFYKRILSGDVNRIGIRLPSKFSRDHRKKSLNNVLISGSDGKLWVFGLMISGDGKLWLQQGWPEFAEHYCLKTGHWLLFDHHGKSVFNVRIFDQSFCELNYPPPENSHMSENEIDEHVTEDDPIMTDADTEVLHAPTVFQEIQASEKRNEVNQKRLKGRALEVAKSFKTDNYFYLTTRKATYSNWGLYVPVSFMRRHLMSGGEKCVNCVLLVSDGRTWGPVKCRDHKSYGKIMGDNWNKFRDENNLGKGDVCVVELIDKMKKVLKVTIFRAR